MEEFRNYLQLKGYKESTIKGILAVVREYKKSSIKDLEDYYQYLKTRKHKRKPEKNLSNGTLNSHISGLEVYLKYLETTGSEETINVKLLKEKMILKDIEILTIEEIQLLFEYCQNNRDKAVFACLYHLGLRASEASNLQLEDIDFKENLVFISRSKTGHQRQIPLPKNAAAIFKTYLKSRNPKTGQEVFLQGLKGKLTSDGLSQVVKRTARRSPITKPVYPHLLRHCIATHLLKNKMQLEQVAQFLGHKSLESTQRYTHLTQQI